MRIHDLYDEEGTVFAFEVESSMLGRRALCRLVQRIPGAKLLKAPERVSWFKEEIFCLFSLEGVEFAALEPFGDSDRYWIGPTPVRQTSQIAVIRAAFANHAPLLERSFGSFFAGT